jgi:hypothetical protein
MWEPQHLTTLWASTDCYRDTFTLLSFTLLYHCTCSTPQPFQTAHVGCIRSFTLFIYSLYQLPCIYGFHDVHLKRFWIQRFLWYGAPQRNNVTVKAGATRAHEVRPLQWTYIMTVVAEDTTQLQNAVRTFFVCNGARRKRSIRLSLFISTTDVTTFVTTDAFSALVWPQPKWT